jgi:hypothetical protein
MHPVVVHPADQIQSFRFKQAAKQFHIGPLVKNKVIVAQQKKGRCDLPQEQIAPRGQADVEGHVHVIGNPLAEFAENSITAGVAAIVPDQNRPVPSCPLDGIEQPFQTLRTFKRLYKDSSIQQMGDFLNSSQKYSKFRIGFPVQGSWLPIESSQPRTGNAEPDRAANRYLIFSNSLDARLVE